MSNKKAEKSRNGGLLNKNNRSKKGIKCMKNMATEEKYNSWIKLADNSSNDSGRSYQYQESFKVIGPNRDNFTETTTSKKGNKNDAGH